MGDFINVIFNNVLPEKAGRNESDKIIKNKLVCCKLQETHELNDKIR